VGKPSRAKRKALRIKAAKLEMNREKSDTDRLFALYHLLSKLELNKSYTMVDDLVKTISWLNAYGKK
jgi:hypothetical protein